MNKVTTVVLAVALGLSLVGCQSGDYSKNMRAATAQAGATVAVKALLDEVPSESYDKTKTVLVTVVADVSRFLDTGKIGDLPVDQAKDALVSFMRQKGWDEYIPMVVGIIDIVEAQKVPISKLGEDNIAIIKLGLEAALTSAATSRAEWRRGTMKAPNRVTVYRGK